MTTRFSIPTPAHSVPLNMAHALARDIASDIACELRAHPEHWTQGAVARAETGKAVDHDCPTAVQWCLSGHVLKGSKPYLGPDPGHGVLPELIRVFEAFEQAIATTIPCWNDAPGRTIEEVIELCESI